MSQHDTSPSHARVIRPHEVDSLWVLRDRIRFMGNLDGTQLAVIDVEVPPGSGTPPHTHASAEIFHVTEGTLTFGQFGDAGPTFSTAEAGTLFFVPSNAPHNYQNRSERPARMLVVVEHALIDFFRDLGRVEDPPIGPPSEKEMGEVLAACARHNIIILGGAPA